MKNQYPYGFCCDTVVKIDEIRIPDGIRQQVYEVMRVIDGKVLFLEEHLDRMVESIRFFSPSTTLDRPRTRALIENLLEANGVRNVNLRIEGFLHDGNEMTLSGYLLQGDYPDARMVAEGVIVSSYAFERPNPHVKTIDLAHRQRVRDYLKKQGAYEAVLYHDGCVTEGSRSNLFLIRDGGVHSARPEDVLSGITRLKVLETAGRLGIPLESHDLPLDEIGTYEAGFLTGTSIHILPIRQFDSVEFNPDHPLLRKLMEGFRETVHSYLTLKEES